MVQLRLEEVQPVLEEFKLSAYLKNGCVTPDNNLLENAIRPFTVGRKNWLFAGTQRGAEASAALYSLVESAKANGLDAYKYLRYIFENIPFAQSTDDYRALLPKNLTNEILKISGDPTGV
nr:transposase [Desulfogranum japonicum]